MNGRAAQPESSRNPCATEARVCERQLQTAPTRKIAINRNGSFGIIVTTVRPWGRVTVRQELLALVNSLPT